MNFRRIQNAIHPPEDFFVKADMLRFKVGDIAIDNKGNRYKVLKYNEGDGPKFDEPTNLILSHWWCLRSKDGTIYGYDSHRQPIRIQTSNEIYLNQSELMLINYPKRLNIIKRLSPTAD